MKIVKKYNLLALLSILMGLYGLTSCSKWLDVKPEDKFLKEHVYGTPESTAEILNGFYLKLGHDSLYGAKLSSTFIEVLAQRYRITSTTSPFYTINQYNYTQKNTEASIADLWTQMYSTIANINDFATILPTVNNGMDQAQKNQMIGEAIGLRAFLHFDLLRMFGNAYSEESKNEPAIPYYRKLSIEIEPIISNEEVLQKILEDIAEAEKLLQNDPIITEGSLNNYNNNRFNLYAVKALKARVYLWKNDKPNALLAAKEVIQAQSLFPWVKHENITITGKDTDRKFFSENIFSVFNSQLNQLFNNNFDSNLLDSELLATTSNNLVDQVYESNLSDYRFTYLWPLAPTGIRTFIKYLNVSNPSNTSRYMIPVIRISEMYYIAAEAATDPTEALGYLNTVRQHRNILTDISDPSILNNEITKEYQKEFYGEGQLWYYYKRKQMTAIPSINNDWKNINMPLVNYQFSLPRVETIPR